MSAPIFVCSRGAILHYHVLELHYFSTLRLQSKQLLDIVHQKGFWFVTEGDGEVNVVHLACREIQGKRVLVSYRNEFEKSALTSNLNLGIRWHMERGFAVRIVASRTSRVSQPRCTMGRKSAYIERLYRRIRGNSQSRW